jgi:hypothetical protein
VLANVRVETRKPLPNEAPLAPPVGAAR